MRPRTQLSCIPEFWFVLTPLPPSPGSLLPRLLFFAIPGSGPLSALAPGPLQSQPQLFTSLTPAFPLRPPVSDAHSVPKVFQFLFLLLSLPWITGIPHLHLNYSAFPANESPSPKLEFPIGFLPNSFFEVGRAFLLLFFSPASNFNLWLSPSSLRLFSTQVESTVLVLVI